MVVRHIGAGRATPCGYYYGLERKEWLLRHEGAARPLLWWARRQSPFRRHHGHGTVSSRRGSSARKDQQLFPVTVAQAGKWCHAATPACRRGRRGL